MLCPIIFFPSSVCGPFVVITGKQTHFYKACFHDAITSSSINLINVSILYVRLFSYFCFVILRGTLSLHNCFVRTVAVLAFFIKSLGTGNY